MGRDATTTGVNAAAAVVAALQAGLGVAGGAIAWLAWERWDAMSFAAGAGCALAGTVAYALCAAAASRGKGGRIVRAHLLAELAKVAVSVTLLVAGLAGQFTAAFYVAGFGAGVLVYPLALLLVNRKMDSN